ncbi:HIT family protein [Allofustis seminis]|uniref:HIT family protein n=1 Tax=Allofustis seminis TaxID=166939 RepID=UPI00035F6944|nr:HIT family protein [Allofustis seminis]
MSETDCIFCKIAHGEIPSKKIHEDENVVAFLDLSQVTPGHTLIIPKAHVRNIYDYDEALAEKVFRVIPKIARALRNFRPDVAGLNIINNNEPVAYQSVFHSHIHLIPRYSDADEFGLKWSNHADQYTDDDLEKIMHAIQKELGE